MLLFTLQNTNVPLSDEMTESQFIAAIDCRFPYTDEARWKAVIDAGVRISANAVFMIYYELAVPPRNLSVDRDALLGILAYLDNTFEHPAKERVSEACRRKIVEGRHLSQEEAAAAIRAMVRYPGTCNALNLFEYCCEDTDDDEIEKARTEVMEEWTRQ
jgi:hypothetical protein